MAKHKPAHLGRKRPIRVGMIRCDTHGMYYGPLMMDHDPMILRTPMEPDEQAPYSWQRGGCWYYFYTHYSRPTQMTAPRVGGFEIVKLWDADRRAALAAAKVFHGKPRVCDSFEECSDDVDLVFISDCNGDGSDHLQLAGPGLRKGVATFVDKPFASSLADVFEMFRLADRFGAALMSTSMLRTTPAALRFRARLPETGGVGFGSMTGSGLGLWGLIHSVTAALTVFGDGVEAVRFLDGPRHHAVHLDYGGRSDRPAHGVMIHCEVGPTPHGAVYLIAVGPRNFIVSEQLGDWEHPFSAAGVLELVRKMVLTGQPTIRRRAMVECVAVALAAYGAQKSGKTVAVADLLRPYARRLAAMDKRA